jgi:predicted alpha/beta superfamily hydrolase
MPGWIDYRDYRPGAHGISGTLKVLPGVRGGEYLGARDLLVWLPPSYARSDARYPVLYMQDGQNLFDAETSYAGEWQVDESMEALATEGLEAIVVGIPNARERRLDEYSPFRDAAQGGGGAYAYLDFLTRVVRASVEAEFRVERAAAATGIFGSSMGGMFALWAHLERPDVFGFAGAMSPSLGFAADGMLRYLRRASWVPGRIYLDGGTAEGVPPGQVAFRARAQARGVLGRFRAARDLLVSKGWREGEDLLYVEERRGRHDEEAWARRFPAAARFLLAPLRRGEPVA